MYSMVMMVAMAGSGDVASFGGHKGSTCCGTPACAPVAVSSGCCGGHHAGLLAGWKAKHSCHGSTAPACCAPAPVCCAAPAPVYVAPAPVCAPAPTCCAAPAPSCGCCGGHHVGLFAKMRAKHSCSGSTMSCAAPSPCGSTMSYMPAAPCSYGTTTVMPPAAPAKEMPKPSEMPKKKDS